MLEPGLAGTKPRAERSATIAVRKLLQRREPSLPKKRDEVKDHLAQDGLSLSGGQQQRLCIARAIAIQPDVLLLDEPCSTIDPLSSAKIEETIDELKQDHTIVIVTHNLQQAARVSDFAGFMYLGQLVEFDTRAAYFPHAEGPAHAAIYHRPLRLALDRKLEKSGAALFRRGVGLDIMELALEIVQGAAAINSGIDFLRLSHDLVGGGPCSLSPSFINLSLLISGSRCT